jgi:tRNA 2-thiouridine synthesizing protein A
MSEEIMANVKLNLEGLMCPMPIAKISKAIKEAAVGTIIEATATDPGVLADIPAWARTSGNEVIKMEREGKLVRFFVKKVK